MITRSKTGTTWKRKARTWKGVCIPDWLAELRLTMQPKPSARCAVYLDCVKRARNRASTKIMQDHIEQIRKALEEYMLTNVAEPTLLPISLWKAEWTNGTFGRRRVRREITRRDAVHQLPV
jgi:hypothetical protein